MDAGRSRCHVDVEHPSCRRCMHHCAMPQPYLVPVSFSESRRIQSNGASGSASTLWAIPLTTSAIDMRLLSCDVKSKAQSCRDGVFIWTFRKNTSSGLFVNSNHTYGGLNSDDGPRSRRSAEAGNSSRTRERS